jgi:serine/threonine protein phosphatase PrpC
MATKPTIEMGDDTTGEFVSPTARIPKVRVECAGRTHPGKVRTNNEDQFLVAKLAKSMRICQTSLPADWLSHFSDEEGYLMLVADGMGGVAGGERASALAVATVEDFVLNVVKWFLHLGGHDEQALFGELRAAFDRADRTVVERAQADPRLVGMGTTLTMAYSVLNDLFVVHAGDTRAYLYRDGDLGQLTTDHTLVQLLVESKALTPEAARHHKRRNVVTNVIGGPRQGVHAEIHKVGLLDGDVLLLCSDGLTEPVEDNQIARVLADAADPADACGRLIDQALQGGGPDNVTAIVARYHVD